MDFIDFSSPSNHVFEFEPLPSTFSFLKTPLPCSTSSVAVKDFLSTVAASASPPPEDHYYPFLQAYPTPLHSSPSSSGRLRVFWSHDDRQPIQNKIRCAFQHLDFSFGGIIQFWAPVCGRKLLATSTQPFVLPQSKKVFHIGNFEAHRLCSLKYQYNVDLNNLQVEDDPTIIPNGAPAVAFLNQLPELLADLRVHRKKNPLVSSAMQSGLVSSVVLPVFDPSQSDCVGVVECFTSYSVEFLQAFNELSVALEKQGLKTFDAQEHLPYKTICGLQNVKDEIGEALKIILQAHCLPFAQVWIPYEDENQVAFSSSSQDTRTKRMLWLKLTGHSCDAFLGADDLRCLEDYSTAHYRLPMKMDEMFAGNTLENYEPLFIQNFRKLNDDLQHGLPHQHRLLPKCFECCFFICLRSTKTGDLDYVFEFLWNHERGGDNVILLESLLLTLERYLPSFKFASGTELGDEIDILDVENSTTSENKYIKIFHRNKISLKRGRQSKVEECLTPLKARGKTTPIKLSREQIESQFGQTLEEAAPKLDASVSTLKRNCNRLGIKWQGKDRLKGNVKHSYKIQSNTNEDEDQEGGAIQDPSSAIIRQTSLLENILTIKAEYAGDVIKFTLPISSATSEAIQKKIVKNFNLDPTAHYKLKYLDDEDNEWFLFDCDEDVTLCTKNKRNVRLRLLQ